MSPATVTELRFATRTAVLPELDRDTRRSALEALAAEQDSGEAQPEPVLAALLALYASRLLDPARITQRWTGLLAAYGRWADREAGCADPLDLLDGDEAEAAYQNALDRLADGTDYETGVDGWLP